MAASLRKERRKKILENREARLRLILGENESESEAVSEQTLEGSTTSTLPSDKVERQKDDFLHDVPFPSKLEKLKTNRRKDSGDENDSDEVKETVRGKHCPPSSSNVSTPRVITTENSSHRTFSDPNQTRSPQVCDSADCLFRVLLNIVFGTILVIYEIQWRPKQLRPSDRKDTTENGVLYQASESFLWSFLALQMFFLCIPRYREISHSSSVAMVSMALQLSGVSSKLITTVNLVLTSVLMMLSDFCMFVFGVIVTYAVIDIAEINKLL